MGFWASGKKAKSTRGVPSDAILHRLECKACPLNRIDENQHPHMAPTGAIAPLIYILGEAPGSTEDKRNKQLIGKSGQKLRDLIPQEFDDLIRWNNVVRTRPREPSGHDRPPEQIEVEACRPSVTRDIVASKPKAIFGFGNIPLVWATGQSGVTKWRGRRTPVNIGGHVCWFYSFVHPAALLRERKGRQRDRSVTEIVGEKERTFAFDLARAFAEIDDLPDPVVFTREDAERDVELIECSAAGLARLEGLLEWAAKLEATGVDIETYPLRPYDAEAKILTMAVGHAKRSFAFALDHPEAKWTKTQRARVDELVIKFLKTSKRKAVHRLQFELEWFGVTYGKELLRASPWECSLNQAMVLDERMRENSPDCSSLEFLVHQYFGFNLKALSPLNKKDLRKEPLEDVLRYNGMDAKFHIALWRAQQARLIAESLNDVYLADLRKLPTLTLTQIKGMPIYAPANEELTKKYTERAAEIEERMLDRPEISKFKAKYGRKFSPSTPKDVGDMLSGVLGFKQVVGRDPESGVEFYTVDEEHLKDVDHPLVPIVIEHRKALKVLSTYLKPYSATEGWVWPDGKIHANLNQPGTKSNRTSADDPNDQNIPKRNEETKEVRKQLRALRNHLMVSCDYGQIQARAIAMMSGDKNFVKYLWDRHDVHEDYTNHLAYAWPERVGGKEYLKDWGKGGAMKNFRTDVKNQWTFPAFFGATLESRAEYLHMPADKIKKVDDKFWYEFGGVREWQERLLKQYMETGVVEHLDGRLNRAPLSRNQIFNYPIQGIEAHIVIGHAFNTVSERAERQKDWYYQPELEIHDDLTFMLPSEERYHGAPMIDDYVKQIVTDMLSCDYDYINVPLSVEVSIGKDLYDMEEVLKAESDTWSA